MGVSGICFPFLVFFFWGSRVSVYNHGRTGRKEIAISRDTVYFEDPRFLFFSSFFLFFSFSYFLVFFRLLSPDLALEFQGLKERDTYSASCLPIYTMAILLCLRLRLLIYYAAIMMYMCTWAHRYPGLAYMIFSFFCFLNRPISQSRWEWRLGFGMYWAGFRELDIGWMLGQMNDD